MSGLRTLAKNWLDREDMIRYNVGSEVSKQFIRVVGMVRFYEVICLSMFCFLAHGDGLSSEPTNDENTTGNAEEQRQISGEARDILNKELLSLVRALSNPPQADASDTGRNTREQDLYVLTFLRFWRRDIIRMGEHVDRTLIDGTGIPSTPGFVAEFMQFSTNEAMLGYNDARRIVGSWQRRIENEIVAKRWQRGDGRMVFTREEKIRAHPQIEALLHLYWQVKPQ